MLSDCAMPTCLPTMRWGTATKCIHLDIEGMLSRVYGLRGLLTLRSWQRASEGVVLQKGSLQQGGPK